jgi:hypothetical protein
MSEFWTAIYPWIVGAIGGLIGAAFLLPTKLGEAIFKYRFDKLIESYKAEQGRELEKLKEQLSHLDDRGKAPPSSLPQRLRSRSQRSKDNRHCLRMNRLDDRVRRRRQKAVDEMRAWDRLRFCDLVFEKAARLCTT